MSFSDLGAGQPAHDEALVLQAVVVLLVSRCLSPAGTLEASERSPAGLGVEGVHHDWLRAFDLAAAERTALTLGLLAHTHIGKSEEGSIKRRM